MQILKKFQHTASRKLTSILQCVTLAMKRLIVQSLFFSEHLDKFVGQNKLLPGDYEELEKRLIQDPEEGDLIQGTGGLRKTRVKSFPGEKVAVSGFAIMTFQKKKGYICFSFMEKIFRKICLLKKRSF